MLGLPGTTVGSLLLPWINVPITCGPRGSHSGLLPNPPSVYDQSSLPLQVFSPCRRGWPQS